MVRKGVSLLEVMFAIGVAAIGLLGVMAVLPLGLHQVGSGNVADRTARAGINALEEFQLRGIGDPDNWRVWVTTPAPGSFVPVTGKTSANPIPLPFGEPPFGQVSFCIDPRMIGYYAEPVLSVPNPPATALTVMANASWFPYTYPGSLTVLRMPRLSLRRSPTIVAPPMTLLQANRVFTFSDELTFSLPDDKTLPPEQVYTWSPGGDGQWGDATVDDDGNGTVDDVSEAGWVRSTGVATDDIRLRRQDDARFSWMATLTPNRDQMLGSENDVYTLSVVIFQTRDPSFAMNASSGLVENERLAMILDANFHARGLGGGEVTFTPHVNSTNPAGDLELKPKDWVLLAGRVPAVPPTNPPITLFEWYRVDETEEEPFFNAAASQWERDATLFGPDWPADQVSVLGDTQVTIVTNVVAVYQQTVRMEFSSLWSN